MKFDCIKNSQGDWKAFVDFTKHIANSVASPRQKLILDAGCGQRAQQALLLHNFGYKVIGIDLVIPQRCRRLGKAGFPLNLRLRLGRIKRLIREYCLYKKYYRQLEVLAGRPLSFKGLDVRQMDILRTEFPNSYFDIVISNAVFEHIPDVDAVCREMKRITKKGGYLFIGIHLFPSLSGGHHDEWRDPACVSEPGVPAWDHLRKQVFPADPSLNRLRFKDYKDLFERYFTIQDLTWDNSQVEPARRFLTDDIRQELAGYADEELLRHSVLAILRN